MLRGKSGRKLNQRQIQNYIYQARRDAAEFVEKSGGDLPTLYNHLSDLKLEDSRWHIAFALERDTLSRVWWMSPYQFLNAKYFGDVLIVDTSYGKDQYDYYLTTFLVVDGNGDNKSIAFCIHSSQDADAYTWMLRRMHSVLDKFSNPQTVLSDRAGGISVAMVNVWPNISHLFCLYHIINNVRKYATLKLREGKEQFIKEFLIVYRSGYEPEFNLRWNDLVRKWSAMRVYLQDLYAIRKQWAWLWVSQCVGVGTRTTGRVEVEHKIYKEFGMSRK